jgi:CRISPR-associated protein Cas5d
MSKPYLVTMEIAGSTALWNRPDVGDAPVSYPAPTYSAAKAIFESILWGPMVLVKPSKVEICAPIQYHSYTTNYGGPLRSNDSFKSGSGFQLSATVLLDVCYKLYAEVLPNHKKNSIPLSALEWDLKTTSPGHAYQNIFNRRLNQGQCYSIPFLGWREFAPSYFGPLRKDTEVFATLPEIRVPSMLREVFSAGYNSPVSYTFDQDVVIRSGCLHYINRSRRYVE